MTYVRTGHEHKQAAQNVKMELSKKQFKVLQAVCNTIIPSIDSKEKPNYWQLKAEDLNVSERIQEAMGVQSLEDQQEFRMLLQVLGNPIASFIFTGHWKTFYQLSYPRREKYLKVLANSPIPPFRKGFNALKKLSCFIFYTDTVTQDPNPTWKAMDYPGPLTPPPIKPKTIQPLPITSETQLNCEVVIVGSGAGGGVVAKELAESGKDILVIEKGSYLNEADYNQKEGEMIANLYEKSGALSNSSGSMAIFAGSCLGGGTVVNWAGTIRTPDYILEEWARENEAPDFLSKQYQKSLDAAEKNIFTNEKAVINNGQNKKLKTGSQKLGYTWKHIAQNIKEDSAIDQRQHGYSCFGDQNSLKQSTLVNHLEAANTHGARFLVNTEVQKVIIKQGNAAGVEAIYTNSEGKKIKITVHAKKVIVAAGALHSPAILIRSGLKHSQIGKNLYLHPVISASGLYKEEINGWWGGMMTITNNEFTNLDGPYGFKIETPPAHTGLVGLSLPWVSGQQHKEMMLQAKHMANFIILTRDKYTGSITLDSQQKPVVHYKLHPYDREHLLKGLKEGIKIHLAAGADKAFILHNQLTEVKTDDDAILDKVINSLNWKENYFNLFSAHQMGTCRIGGNKKSHPVSPEGETYEVKGLYVTDCSAFPKSSGANPMLSVEGLAHYIAQGLK